MEELKLSREIEPERGPSNSLILVYDGSCGFCSRSVQFLLRHERRHDLLFVTRDSELGGRLRSVHGLESVQSMIWIEGGQAFVESNAVMKAADYLGGWWTRMADLARCVPPIALNRLYKLIASNRRRLSANVRACQLPSPEQRRRFLA